MLIFWQSVVGGMVDDIGIGILCDRCHLDIHREYRVMNYTTINFHLYLQGGDG